MTHPTARRLVAAAATALLATTGLAALAPAPAHAEIYVVVNQNDSGEGSLRDALDKANQSPESDTIFIILPSQTPIFLTAPLTVAPTTTAGALIIDGGEVLLDGRGTTRLFDLEEGANLRLSNLSLYRGFAPERGGAILSRGNLILDGVSVEENITSQGNPGAGSSGVITAVSGDLVVRNSTFHDNTVSSDTAATGGAITAGPGTTLTVENSTFFANTASASGIASGAAIDSRGTASIVASTFTRNRGVAGSTLGAVTLNSGSLTGVIAAGNTDGGDLTMLREEPVPGSGGNVVGTTNVPFDGPRNRSGVDAETAFGRTPTLEPVDDILRGVPLGDNALAVNRIPDLWGYPATDQRGVDRRTTGTGQADAGAYELQDPMRSITIAPPSLPNGTQGIAYSQLFRASGGVAPYTYAVTDGSVPPGMTVSSDGLFSGSPTAGGTFNFTVAATDDGAFTGSRAYSITIAAQPQLPVVRTSSGSTVFTVRGPRSARVPVDPGLEVADPDSANLSTATVSITAGLAPGDALDVGAFPVPPGGTTTYNSGTGVLEIRPAQPISVAQWQELLRSVRFVNGSTSPSTGNRTISFVVRDTDGLESIPATKTVTVADNRGPAALADNYDATEDTPLVVPARGVLANDADPDGDTLTAALATGPANGTVELATDGSFTYRPRPNFAGTDSFTYTASNGRGTSPPAAVTLNVAARNDAPVAESNSYDAVEDTPLVVPARGVLANDTDVEGDALTARLASASSNGRVTLAADGSFTYVPSANFFGTDSFTYTVSDGNTTDTGTVTVRVAPVDDAPVARDDSFVAAGDGSGGVRLDVPAPGVLGNDDDVDDPAEALRAVYIDGPQHGTVRLDDRGGFVYVSTPGYAGADSFTYRTFSAGRPERSSGQATVRIEVDPDNVAPTISEVADQELEAGETKDALPVTVDDPDGDVDDLSVEAVSSDPEVIAPDGLVLGGEGADRTLTLTAPEGAAGTTTIILTVTDPDGGQAISSFDVVVTPAAPDPDPEPDPEPGPASIRATLTAPNNGPRADVLTVRTTAVGAYPAGQAAGAFTKLVKVTGRGEDRRRRTVASGRLGADGAIRFVRPDRNGRNVTKYFAVINPQRGVNFGARTNTRNVR